MCRGIRPVRSLPLPSSISISLSFSSLATAREHSSECFSVAVGSVEQGGYPRRNLERLMSVFNLAWKMSSRVSKQKPCPIHELGGDKWGAQ